jgi:hypothetical protein
VADDAPLLLGNKLEIGKVMSIADDSLDEFDDVVGLAAGLEGRVKHPADRFAIRLLGRTDHD